jgi:hypothetical protein
VIAKVDHFNLLAEASGPLPRRDGGNNVMDFKRPSEAITRLAY